MHACSGGAIRRSLAMFGAAAVSAVLLAACTSATTPQVSVGPTISAAATNSAPTVQADATRAAPTVQAALTQTAPTAHAISTRIAPTVQAASTAAAPTVQALATQSAPVLSTVTASAPIRVTDARVTTSELDVTLQNTGVQPLNIGGWSLQVGTAKAALPQGLKVQAGDTVTIHSNSGTSGGSNVYLGQEGQQLVSQVHAGVTVSLENPSGNVVSSFAVPNS